MMKPYKSKSGKTSGVTAYSVGREFITIRFESSEYTYSYQSCGKAAVETMQKLAAEGNGLSTFVSQTQPAYESKK